jgi:predicted  nucleic acid-binding Zn-ribbon protein
MEFGPIRDPAGSDICDDCGKVFDHMNEEAIEDRCPECQSKFRIRNANKMHDTGEFISHIKPKTSPNM